MISQITWRSWSREKHVDTLGALAYQDGICATVSAIEMCADGLSMVTSFIPGPNVITVITIPVLVGRTVFIHCYKKAKKHPGADNFKC